MPLFYLNGTEVKAEAGSLILYTPYAPQSYTYPCGRQTEAYFIHLFKNVTGLSPQEYKTCIVMEKAKELLTETTLNVTGVANHLGYTDSLYFSRVFKKHTGHSPSMHMK